MSTAWFFLVFFSLAQGGVLQNAAPSQAGCGTAGSWQAPPPFPEASQALEELRLLLVHLRYAQTVAFGAFLLGKDPPVL